MLLQEFHMIVAGRVRRLRGRSAQGLLSENNFASARAAPRADEVIYLVVDTEPARQLRRGLSSLR